MAPVELLIGGRTRSRDAVPDTRPLAAAQRATRPPVPGAIPVGCGWGCLAVLEPDRPSAAGTAVHHPLFDHPDAVRTRHLTGRARRATTPVLFDAARGVAGPHWNHRKATA
ncbi:hypothetical protein [Streptomyces sp. NPDC001076]